MGSYSAPVITSAGLQIPTFTEYLNYLISQYLASYGSAVYLGNDSADYQDIVVRALQASDTVEGLQAVWLSFNPLTAVGTSLDLLGQLIGTVRKSASYSTALMTLAGTSGTTVNNGVVRDVNGILWSLPASVLIGSGGTAAATATCQVLGNITSNPGDISVIATPTAGWQTATNPGSAIPGGAVEPDSSYRARLIISQAKPSLTRVAGTAAAVAAVSGVTRSVVYENPGGFTASFGFCSTSGTAVTILFGYPLDSSDVTQAIVINGVPYSISAVAGGGMSCTLGSSAGSQTAAPFYLNAYASSQPLVLGPPHSISAVVEGGVAATIAQAIYDNRGIGPYTNGSTTVTVADPLNPAITMPISFAVLGYTQIYVAVSVYALAGFTSVTLAAIASGIVNYLNSLSIGEVVVYSELYGAALTARPNPDTPLFSIRALSSAAPAAITAGTLTIGTDSVTSVANMTGVMVGQVVVGNGVPPGTTVATTGSGTFTMSANATLNGIGVALAFFSPATSDISIAYNYAAQGLAANVLVTQV